MTQLFLLNIMGNFKKIPKILPSAVIRFIYPKSGRTKIKDYSAFEASCMYWEGEGEGERGWAFGEEGRRGRGTGAHDTRRCRVSICRLRLIPSIPPFLHHN